MGVSSKPMRRALRKAGSVAFLGDLIVGPAMEAVALVPESLHTDRRIVGDHFMLDRMGEQHAQRLQ